ncbi:zinc-ribbon domain-containing protein [Ureibacillus chungkukjangi]|uniref:zinc-ribbon domain-containing protein n=1 Tax=Ureibacillus chungkukjangi TaxID=1202712 RepID=UPI00203D4A19|nr:zinc-ribbon domain-containing protein [Ureibacillus chungkukjangi]MCM3387201.1 zinc-ribbon domain-containing protein [Ureibacillus chungkukjangi]
MCYIHESLDLEKVKKLSENSMLKVKPELFLEWHFQKNNELGFDIYKMKKGSNKKAWWICDKCKSKYDMHIYHRVNGSGCPYCRGMKANETNSLASLRPEIAMEWDHVKNIEFSPDNVVLNSNKKVWWVCPDCDSSYDMIISLRTGKDNCGCPYCAGHRVNETNSLSTKKPDISLEWDYEKNDNKLTPLSIYYRSRSKVWWVCPDCKSSYDMAVVNRTRNNQKCPYCHGLRVNNTNSLATVHPSLASQWHPTKNKKTAHDYTVNSGRKVWWLGDCGHEWEANIANRSNGANCPYCSGHKLLKGFNDMWTTNPTQASLLLNSEDGFRYTQYSRAKVDWQCPDCGEVLRQKSIGNVMNSGLSCPTCSNSMSLPESIMYHLLNTLNVEFLYNKSLAWSDSKRYDFYIPLLSTIIETHGGQHYKEIGRGRTLKEEQENDRYKHDMAIRNEISKYIVIDCKYNKFDYIKNNIINSDMSHLFDLITVNWELIEVKSKESLIKDIVKLWNDGIDTVEISKKIKLDPATIKKYIKKAAKLGWVEYSDKTKKEQVNTAKKPRKRKVVKIQNNKAITIYESIKEAAEENNVLSCDVINVCSGKNNSLKGINWMYHDDYIENGIRDFSDKKEKIVVQLSLDMKYIGEYPSITEAAKSLGKTSISGISACCKGGLKTAYGFIWMYRNDYLKWEIKEA